MTPERRKGTRLETDCCFLYFSIFSFPFLLHHRDELFRQSLAKLREQLVKANTLVREANFLAEEMSKLTDYQVTLQIPATNLSANRKVRMRARCALVNPVRWTVNLTSTITSPRRSSSEPEFSFFLKLLLWTFTCIYALRYVMIRI